jgi:hypothetical protein
MINELTPELEVRYFYVFGTGHPIPDWLIHRGTAITPPFVWHLYEEDLS